MTKINNKNKLLLLIISLILIFLALVNTTRLDYILIISAVVVLCIEFFCDFLLKTNTTCQLKSNEFFKTFLKLEKFSFGLFGIFIFSLIIVRLFPWIMLSIDINNSYFLPFEVIQIDYFPIIITIILTLITSIFPPIISINNYLSKTNKYIILLQNKLRVSSVSIILLRISTITSLMFILLDYKLYSILVLIFSLLLSIYIITKISKTDKEFK